jgi:hypothetical protein
MANTGTFVPNVARLADGYAHTMMPPTGTDHVLRHHHLALPTTINMIPPSATLGHLIGTILSVQLAAMTANHDPDLRIGPATHLQINPLVAMCHGRNHLHLRQWQSYHY